MVTARYGIIADAMDILKQKSEEYGDYILFFNKLSERWTATVKGRPELTPELCALMMAQLKFLRVELGNGSEAVVEDSLLDAVAYLTIADRIRREDDEMLKEYRSRCSTMP